MKEEEILRREVLKLDTDKRLLEDKVYKLKIELDKMEKRALWYRKLVVWYRDIEMVGEHSEDYEDGFWDAVTFVRRKQTGETE
jgi:hypothetical protein